MGDGYIAFYQWYTSKNFPSQCFLSFCQANEGVWARRIYLVPFLELHREVGLHCQQAFTKNSRPLELETISDQVGQTRSTPFFL